MFDLDRLVLTAGALNLCFNQRLRWIAAPSTTAGSIVSGGVSDGELQSLYAKREQFSLWVITAAKKSGAYLADVRLKVSDSKQRVVFDRKLDGPWLLIDLPLGRYQMEAIYEGEASEENDHHTSQRSSPGDFLLQ